MNIDRRLALSAVALAGVAACTVAQTAGIQPVFNAIQFVLPLEKALAVGLSVAVPQAAGLIAAVQPYLDKAAPIFQKLQASMTAAEGKPLIQQIEGYAKDAMEQIVAVVANAPPGSRLASFQPLVMEAQAALAVITAFVSGVSAMPTAATAAAVPVPLLHR